MMENRSIAINGSVTVLEENNFSWISNLASGSFGTVIEVKNKSTEKIFAAKIVLEDNAKDSEINLWKSLSHDNILPVLESYYLPQPRTWVFITPKHKGSLASIQENSPLHVKINGLSRALTWLCQVVKGVTYLHQKSLCHLDLKLSNILISNSDVAVVSDFGSLTYTHAAVNNYASPFIYRPPEAKIIENGEKTVVDGYKYDIYTLGLLAAELFTKQRIVKTAKLCNQDPDWEKDMYPVIFNILEKKQFKKLVKIAFIVPKLGVNIPRIIRNFIIGCIDLNPRNRPTVERVVKHRLIGGSKKFKARKNNIWKVKTSSEKIRFLNSLFIAQAASLILPSVSSNYLQDHNANEEVDELSDQINSVKSHQETKRNEIDHNVLKSDSIVYFTKEQNFPEWTVRTKSGIGKLVDKEMKQISDQSDSIKNVQEPQPNEIDEDEILCNSDVPLIQKQNIPETLTIRTNSRIAKLVVKEMKQISDQTNSIKSVQELQPNEMDENETNSHVPLFQKQNIQERTIRTESRIVKMVDKEVNELSDPRSSNEEYEESVINTMDRTPIKCDSNTELIQQQNPPERNKKTKTKVTKMFDRFLSLFRRSKK